MKRVVPLRKHTVRILPAIIGFLMITNLHSYAVPLPAKKIETIQAYDSIVVQRQFTSRKYKVKLYPNASQQVLFFSASGDQEKIYQLFLFNMDGILVKQANIKNKQTTVINNIDKGIYLFEVFSDDERIENGKVTVR